MAEKGAGASPSHTFPMMPPQEPAEWPINTVHTVDQVEETEELPRTEKSMLENTAVVGDIEPTHNPRRDNDRSTAKYKYTHVNMPLGCSTKRTVRKNIRDVTATPSGPTSDRITLKKQCRLRGREKK